MHDKKRSNNLLTRILKLLFVLPLICFMVMIVIINVKLDYHHQVKVNNTDTINYDVVKELRHLKSALNHDADVDMQNLYPEGYVFLNAVYALAWTSLLQNGNTEFMDEGIAEAGNAWMKINSSTGRAPFNEELSLPYGAFYNGWSAYVLGSRLRLEKVSTRKKQAVDHFKEQCSTIARAIQQRTFPVSYYGSAWPADAFLCVAALSIHDKLFNPQYRDTIGQWLVEVKKRLDKYGMIPHSVDPGTGKALENARGSSLALMLVFLRDIDPKFGEAQFKLFKENFVASRLGLTGIREYRKDEFGIGDVDSGPVILGFGGAATIVGMQSLYRYGERTLSTKIRNEIEALSFSWETENEKKYLFGLLPIADAFIAWSHAGIRPAKEEISFMQFRLYSLLIFALLAVWFWALVSNKAAKKKRCI